MDRKNLTVTLLLLVLFSFILPSAKAIDFSEDFDSYGNISQDYYDGDANSDCGDLSKLETAGNKVYTDGVYSLYICNGLQGSTTSNFITSENPSNLAYNKVRTSFSSGTFQSVMIFNDICKGELCYLNNDTRLQFYFDSGTSFDNGGSGPAHIGFYNSKESFTNPTVDVLNLDPNTKAWDVNIQDAPCSLHDYVGSFDGGNTVDFVLGDVTCENVDVTQPVDSMFFYFWNDDLDGATGDFQYFDNLTISGMVNASNSLPSFNVTLDQDLICVDSDTQSVQFNFTIDAYDMDGDSIIYGNNVQQDISVWDNYTVKVLDFERLRNIFGGTCNGYNPPFCWYNIDPNDLAGFVEVEGYCNLTTDIVTTTEFNNVVKKDDFLDRPVGMLHLKDSCTGLNNVLYPFDDFTREASAVYELYVPENSTFNLTFYEDGLVKKYDITVTTDDSYTVIDYKDETQDIQVFNLTYAERMSIEFNSFNNPEGGEVFFNLQTGSNPSESAIVNITLDTDMIVFWGLESEGTDLYVDKFIMKSISYDLGYVSAKPNNVTFKGYGTYGVDIIVSDSFNYLSDRYVSDRIFVSIAQPEVCAANVLRGADENGVFIGSLRPDTGWSSLDDIIEALRQFYNIANDTGVLSFVRIGVLVGLFAVVGLFFKRLVMDAQQSFDNAMRITAVMMMFLVALLYVMLLVNQTVFLIFSMIGLLYLSYEVLNVSGSAGAGNAEEHWFYVAATFTVFQFIWFTLFNVVSVTPLLPSFPAMTWSFNLTVLGTNISNFFLYLFELVFFTVPDVPFLLASILTFAKILGVFSLIAVGYNKIRGI